MSNLTKYLKDVPQDFDVDASIAGVEYEVAVTEDTKILTPRWTPLRFHQEQLDFYRSTSRFNVVAAGRRSGKTERAKRRLVIKAISHTKYPNARFLAAAPTHAQAKRIFWNDLKQLVPRSLRRGAPSESELVMPLANGASIQVIGLDKPERVEGSPITYILIDEIADCKPKVWSEHIRAALSDQIGEADLIGVPEGRNFFFRLWDQKLDDWQSHHWVSADILPPEEIEAARRDLDPLTFQQEFEASFVVYGGRAYYTYSDANHAHRLKYQPGKPLILTLDFNVEPGTAVTHQEFPLDYIKGTPEFTGAIKEVWVPQDSRTDIICKKFIEQWPQHKGQTVYVYGDATGGARHTSQTIGTDWDQVKNILGPVFDLRVRVDRSNPGERARVNAVNSRVQSADGSVKYRVDPVDCPQLVLDFEGVRIDPKTGEIDKKSDSMRTHLTDGAGYYIAKKYPIRRGTVTVESL